MSTETELHRQNERLDLLLNLTSRITSNLDLRELLRATSANIRDVVQADAAGVAFFDEASNKSRIYAVDFPDAKGFVKEELVVTPGHALKRAWESSKAVIVNTDDREELGPEIYDLVIAEGLDAHCLIPLVSRSRPIGLLILARKGQKLFTSEDVDFLTRASGQIAIAIENALVFQEVSGVRDRLRLLLTLTSRITSSLDLREVVRAVAANIREVIDADAVGVALPDAASGKFRIFAMDFPHGKGGVKEELLVTPGAAYKKAMDTLKPVVIDRWEPDELGPEIYAHPEGQEELIIQPYSLKATRQTGFLVDFHFRLAKGVPFSRKIQQLSLSLDRNFRRNSDYCIDRSTTIRQFLDRKWSIFEAMQKPGTSDALRTAKEFITLPAERLRPKVYVFAGDKESRSQFTGLRDFGPLQPVDGPPRLLFMFREQDRQAARRLALSLRGLKQRSQYNFPGFKALFKADLDIDSNPVVLPDLTEKSMESALKHAEAVRDGSSRLLPVIVLPNDDNNGYLAQKAYFTHAGMPTQVCTLRILEDEESLKWAIGNLAAGGRPWKVRPTAEHSLIIGVSQSHKCRIVNDRVQVDKYFAFSVLTDSSGLFQQIQVLGDSQDHTAYIGALRANLKKVLEESASHFNRVVIHTSFKLRYEEIKAIQQTAHDVAAATDRAKCRFAVIKVNHKCRFFGTNRSVNSLVPFEATKVRLGPTEHLVWFEGIYPDKPNVTKAFPGPTHLEFLRVDDNPAGSAEQRELLQDLVNDSASRNLATYTCLK